jgi:AraC-like DNA-binding protein
MTTYFSYCTDIHVRKFTKSFWQTEGAPVYTLETILPKGAVEIIFSFGDPLSFSDAGNKISTIPRCFVTGIRDIPVQLAIPARQSFFGFELHAAAVKKLLKLPAGELHNTISDLEDIDAGFTDLWHQLAASASFESKVKLSSQWINRKSSPIQDREFYMSAFLTQSPSSLSVAGLASEFCYSTRQLHRKTAELFGMSTEALIGYRRYMHALQLMHYSNDTLTGIGYDCNYYDQAHFIREFKAYTGLTPGDYRRQKSKLAGHIFQ